MENNEEKKEMGKTIIGDYNRTTVPELIRIMLNLKKGDYIKWLFDGEKYYVEKSE